MSAAFKLAKKKVSQNDLRKLMQEQKHLRGNGDKSNVKIDSPFAKYDKDQLSCQLCKKKLSPNVWKVHINSKQHKENLTLAKELKEKLVIHAKPPPTIKERVASMKEEKKLKGILKNSQASVSAQDEKVDETSNSVVPTKTVIPDDFFDTTSKPNTRVRDDANPPAQEGMQVDDTLPEGFFDDPKKDAKARNLEYKNPVEEEWEKFRKEIKEAEVHSMSIINEEQEESTVERQIDEIDAQIKNWSR